MMLLLWDGEESRGRSEYIVLDGNRELSLLGCKGCKVCAVLYILGLCRQS